MADYPDAGYLSDAARTNAEMKAALEQWLAADKNIRVKIFEPDDMTFGEQQITWLFPNVEKVTLIVIGQGGGKGRKYGDTTASSDGGNTEVWVEKADGTRVLRDTAAGGVKGGDARLYASVVYPGQGGGYGTRGAGECGTFNEVYHEGSAEPRYFGGRGGRGFLQWGHGATADFGETVKCGGGGQAGAVLVRTIDLNTERASGYVKFRFVFNVNLGAGRIGAVIALW